MTNMSIDGDDSLELANQLSPTLNMVIMITIIIKITRIQGFFLPVNHQYMFVSKLIILLLVDTLTRDLGVPDTAVWGAVHWVPFQAQSCCCTLDTDFMFVTLNIFISVFSSEFYNN